MVTSSPHTNRNTIFVSHAAPEDNLFALWLSSKLASAGYHVWVDRNRLRGGHDFWDEIEDVLRNAAIKQVVVFTKNVRKPGVKKELALGEIMKGKLSDPNFVIGIRADESAFSDAPPELLRGNILNAYPNWHDCLKELFDTLEHYKIRREASLDAGLLSNIVQAREEGRRFINPAPEIVLTNWFPVIPPSRIRYFKFDGIQEHLLAWCRDCRQPHVSHGRLVGTFVDQREFLRSSSFDIPMAKAYDLSFESFLEGKDLGPYTSSRDARNDVVNLLRQHFDKAAGNRGLLPVRFANGDLGWFFPDGLASGNTVTCLAKGGRRIRRSVSGRFKALRWHLCLVAKPRIWPSLVLRLHANVVLSVDGMTPMPGDKTHARRRRLTRSWWNDVWRDRLLAAMNFLASGNDNLDIVIDQNSFSIATWPLVTELPVSYEAADPPMPSDEDDEGNIISSAELDDYVGDDDPDEIADGPVNGSRS